MWWGALGAEKAARGRAAPVPSVSWSALPTVAPEDAVPFAPTAELVGSTAVGSVSVSTPRRAPDAALPRYVLPFRSGSIASDPCCMVSPLSAKR